jgi:hypothetical protein
VDKVALLQRALDDERQRAVREWWEQPMLIGSAGALVGAGVVVGSVFLLAQLRPSLPQ